MKPHGMQVSQQSGGMDVALDIWRRRKWLAVVIFVLVFAGVASVTVFLPDVYESTATILVERQQVPEAFVQATVTSSIDIRLQTITQQVLSRSRLEGLINRFGLYVELRQQVPLEGVIGIMRQAITLDQKGDMKQKGSKSETTVAFAISYKGENPQQVAQVTNALASFYIDENLKVRELQAVGTAEFLNTQLAEVKHRLEEEEKLLSKFKENYMGELPEQLSANLAVLERLNTQLRLNSEKRSRSMEQRVVLAQQLAELEGQRPRGQTMVVPEPTPKPDASAERREKLQQELTALRIRYNENYPDISLLKAQIAAIEQQPAALESPKKPGQPTDAPPTPYMQQMKKEIGELEAEIKALNTEEKNALSSIARYQQRVENTPRRDQELLLILRDYDTAKSLYQSLLKRVEEAKLAENLEQRQKGEQFRLLEPALPQEKPVAPKRSKLLLMGLVAAMGLAGGAVILSEQLHPSFHTADALGAFTQVPVLVSLPRIVIRADRCRRCWRFGLGALATLLALVLIVGTSYIVIKRPEQLASFSARLQSLRK